MARLHCASGRCDESVVDVTGRSRQQPVFAGKRYRRLAAAALFIVTAACDSAAAAEALTGRQIMDRVAKLHKTPYEFEIQRVILVDKRGNEETRLVRRYQRKGKHLVVFHDPPGVRGVALLIWYHAQADDDQWLYLPSMGEKMKRIAAGSKRNYFMGTDYTYEDLVAEPREKFEYRRLDDEVIDGIEHFVIEAHPKDDRLKKTTGYKFRRLWVHKDIFFIVRTDYFDRRGRFIKRQIAEDYYNVGRTLWRAKQILMDNQREQHKTRILVEERSFEESAVPKRNFQQRFVTSGMHIR